MKKSIYDYDVLASDDDGRYGHEGSRDYEYLESWPELD